MGNDDPLATGHRHCYPLQAKGSSLDPSRADDGTTSKIGYDATIHLIKTRKDSCLSNEERRYVR